MDDIGHFHLKNEKRMKNAWHVLLTWLAFEVNSCFSFMTHANNQLKPKVKPLNINSSARKEKSNIFIRFSPLIGGPRFLPIHVEVILSSESGSHKCDFIPLEARNPQTMKQLLTLRAVSGQVRYTNININTNKEGIWMGVSEKEDAKEFCENYNNELHLITNNCYTFAWKLLDHLIDFD